MVKLVDMVIPAWNCMIDSTTNKIDAIWYSRVPSVRDTPPQEYDGTGGLVSFTSQLASCIWLQIEFRAAL